MNAWLLPPNLISVARVLMTPVIAWKLVEGDVRAAFWWIFAASVSDMLDGALARRFGWGSELGQKLDPAADKLMLVCVYVALATGGWIPWWIAGLVVGRDLMIVTFAAWAAGRISLREFKPSTCGKVSTLMQMMYAGVVVAGAAWPHAAFLELRVPLMWTVVMATVCSGVGYGLIGQRMMKERGADRGD
jgi:cardiolipin synthase